MTRKKVKKEDEDGGALLISLEGAFNNMSLKLELESIVPSKPEAKPKAKKKKATKRPIFTPPESPEPETQTQRNGTTALGELLGTASELENWQRLCLDLDVDTGDLSSLTKCKKALKKINVNILDVVEAQLAREEAKGKAGSEDGGVKIKGEDETDNGLNVKKFNTRAELLRYTKRHHKFYSKKSAKELGPIRSLLKIMK